MGRIWQLRERHRTGWGIGAVLLAVLLLAGAVFSFALGTCHDAGGFCGEPFGRTHLEAYASAAALAGLGMLVGASAVTTRASRLAIAATAGAAAPTVLAILGEWRL